MSTLARFSLVLLAVASLQVANAACKYPPEVTVPDGNTATKEEMLAANAAMKEYRAKVDEYLACLDEEEKPLPADATEAQRQQHEQEHRVLIAKHNAAVDAETALADRYNEQVRAFKKKQGN